MNHKSVQEEERESNWAASVGSESKGTPSSQWGPLGRGQDGAAHAPNLYRNVHGSCGVTAGNQNQPGWIAQLTVVQ